jgi:hypothetical protein
MPATLRVERTSVKDHANADRFDPDGRPIFKADRFDYRELL